MDKMTLLTTQLGLTEQAIQAQRTKKKIHICRLLPSLCHLDWVTNDEFSAECLF